MRIEQQETSTTGADHLAADGAGIATYLVPAVDRVAGHVGRPLLLHLPMLVHELTELLSIAVFERCLNSSAELLDVVQIVYHRPIAGCGSLVLVVENFGGRARIAGEEQEQ